VDLARRHDQAPHPGTWKLGIHNRLFAMKRGPGARMSCLPWDFGGASMADPTVRRR
jgi:hypothetical protein